MRRREKEITDITAIEAIIQRASVCRLAVCDQGIPYIIPLCFGYQDRVLYFHTAREGRKLEILRENDRVCVEFDPDQELVRGELPCKWTMKFRSVVGFGRATLIDDPGAKKQALDIIMRQYGAEPSGEYAEPVLQKTLIIKVDIEQITGKESGYK